MKAVETLTIEGGKITLFGGRRCRLDYRMPEWNQPWSKANQFGKRPDEPGYREPEPCFRHYGRRYWLSEFERPGPGAPDWILAFDGYHADSFFSGIAIKLNGNDETVQPFTFIAS